MKLKIIKNKAKPLTKAQMNAFFPFNKMEIDDCFIVNINEYNKFKNKSSSISSIQSNITSAIYNFKKQNVSKNKIFITRKIDNENIGCWRIK